MRACLFFILLGTLVVATSSLDHLTLRQLQGVEEAKTDSNNVIEVKHEVKLGKAPYGGGNIARDPHVSKNNAPSHHLWSFSTYWYRFWFLCASLVWCLRY